MLATVKLGVRLSKRRHGGPELAPFVLEARTVERLTFGITARRRARAKKLKRRLALASLVATALGLPGATFGLDLLQRTVAPGGPTALGGIETTESAASLLQFRNKLIAGRAKDELPARNSSPTAADEPVAAAGGSITESIYAAAAEFGLDGDYLLSIAQCESSLNPSAVNAVGYYGLFQFDETTWSAYGYGSIYDPVAQSYTAARLIAAGQTSRWPNCA
jgi:soluble lytic murein transglycosylase-like protein